MTDSLVTPTGDVFKFQPPSGESLPLRGFDSGIVLPIHFSDR
jgi:hypothetical protein